MVNGQKDETASRDDPNGIRLNGWGRAGAKANEGGTERDCPECRARPLGQQTQGEVYLVPEQALLASTLYVTAVCMKTTTLFLFAFVSAAYGQIDPKIPMSFQLPKPPDLLDTAMRAAQIRLAQQQAELQAAQTRALQAETDAQKAAAQQRATAAKNGIYIPPPPATQYFQLEDVKRISQDLYRNGDVVFETKYCYEYASGDKAVLKYKGKGSLFNEVIWANESKCDVAKIGVME